jgi:dTMP kinase
MKGKLIVFDGNDGSGKATQVARIVERFKEEGVAVQTIDFPRYYDNFFGKFIGECLTGEHGDFIKANPRVVSVLYAADRFESNKQIQSWLDEGYVVIADRYVSANQIHQGSKIQDSIERKEFLQWLDTMEHEAFGLVRPDMIVYLDVPVQLSLKNLQAKREKYSEGKSDASEKDVEYLTNSRSCAQELAADSDSWRLVNCAENGAMRSIEDIHEDVYAIIKKDLKIHS